MREFNHWNAILNKVTTYRKEKKADSIANINVRARCVVAQSSSLTVFGRRPVIAHFQSKQGILYTKKRGSCGEETNREERAADLLENRAKRWRSFIQ